MKKIGAELILTVIVVPIFAWIITSIINLQSSFAEINLKTEYSKQTLEEIKNNVEYIRQKMEK